MPRAHSRPLGIRALAAPVYLVPRPTAVARRVATAAAALVATAAALAATECNVVTS